MLSRNSSLTTDTAVKLKKLNIDTLRPGKMLVIMLSAIAVIVFLLISNNLIKELARQERERMDIWAQATERLAKADVDSDFEFLLAIISQNNTIPVMISDSNFNISEFRNFDLPDGQDADKSLYSELTPRNQEYLLKRLKSPGGDTPLAGRWWRQAATITSSRSRCSGAEASISITRTPRCSRA